MRKLIVISLLFLGAIGILVFINLLRRPPVVELNASPVLAANVQYPILMGTQSLRYFNGSAVVDYDLEKQVTKRVSGIYRLPTITALKWGDNKLLVRGSGYSTTDQLRNTLVTNRLDTNLPWWWIVNLKTNKIELLAKGGYSIEDAIWQDENIIFASQFYGPDERIIYKIYRLSTGSHVSELATVNSFGGFLQAGKQKLRFSSGQNGVSEINELDLTSKNTRVLASGFRGRAVFSDSSDLVAYLRQPAADVEGLRGDLVIKNIESGKEQVLLENFTGHYQFGTNNTLYILGYDSGDNFIGASFQLAGDQLKRSDLKVKDIALEEIDIGSLTLAATDADVRILTTDSKNRLRLFSQTAQSLKASSTLENTPKLAEPVYQRDFHIIYVEEKNLYWIYIFASPFSQTQSQVLKYITALGIDPNQLNILWIPDDGIDPAL